MQYRLSRPFHSFIANGERKEQSRPIVDPELVLDRDFLLEQRYLVFQAVDPVFDGSKRLLAVAARTTTKTMSSPSSTTPVRW